jgi:uncharacterized membrane protein HdeD (DUF308 family)
MAVLQAVTLALAIGGLVLYKAPNLKVTLLDFAPNSGVAFLIATLAFILANPYEIESMDKLFLFKSLVILFVVLMAILETVLSFKSAPEDKLELRISAALGAITGLLFISAPLNGLNAVGFFSAYLALSAVQRAVWAAGPSYRKKNVNGKK